MRKLGERLLHDGGVSYEDISGPPGPSGGEPMELEPDERRRMPTRDDESESLKHHFHQLLKVKLLS